MENDSLVEKTNHSNLPFCYASAYEQLLNFPSMNNKQSSTKYWVPKYTEMDGAEEGMNRQLSKLTIIKKMAACRFYRALRT